MSDNSNTQPLVILIVDDVPSNLFTLGALLEEHFEEVKVVEANSGFEALEKLMRQPVDLIILDIQMPEMDGFQTAKLIRSRKKTKNIPIVFLTAAYKSDQFRNQGFSLGATDYLTKPIDDYQLTNRINSYLSIIKLEKNYQHELERKVIERTLELEQSNQKLENTLEKLQNAQKQVIAQEKLASLGELTAGIAHEIKNPLNFIINFSELSQELSKELKEVLLPLQNQDIDKYIKDEVNDITTNLSENAAKINAHGKRADSIINNMLIHSYDKKGIYQQTNINQMLEEYASLAYYSMLNNHKGFSATIEHDFDKSIGTIKIIPQDMSRVLLNMFNNAYQALKNKSKNAQEGYIPTLFIKTSKEKNHLAILIKDNGSGISKEVIDKIFNPFFTTKPAGQGTGLGLSICYDIITNIHKGEIQVISKENQYTEFSILLPFKK